MKSVERPTGFDKGTRRIALVAGGCAACDGFWKGRTL